MKRKCQFTKKREVKYLNKKNEQTIKNNIFKKKENI